MLLILICIMAVLLLIGCGTGLLLGGCLYIVLIERTHDTDIARDVRLPVIATVFGLGLFMAGAIICARLIS